MKAGSTGSVSLPSDLSVRTTRLFLRVGFIFLLALATSCSSTKKLKQSHTEKETSVDRTLTATSTLSAITTTEKLDTTVHLKADTTSFRYFTPWLEADTATHFQEVETPTAKISIAIKPVFAAGRRTESQVSVTAIKKKDSVTVKIDKKTEANVAVQMQIKNDITGTKETKVSAKTVEKKRFNFTGVLLCLGMLIILIIAIYYYLKNKKRL